MNGPLLDVTGLCMAAPGPGGMSPVIEELGFRLDAGKILGLIGESGCGKSLTALSLIGLEGASGCRRTAGRALFCGRDLFTMASSGWRAFRGAQAAMIFQEPGSALNPVLTCGRQTAEVMRAHHLASKAGARARALTLFDQTGLDDPLFVFGAYPFELSGGQLQRVTIAMALAGDPKLLLADEPTTALDVAIQGQILCLLRRAVDERGMGLVLITHDLAVAAQLCDDVLVMYAGEAVENAPVLDFFAGPLHPYAAGLLASLPSRAKDGFGGIEGSVPLPGNYPPGCRFAPRCLRADATCRTLRPKLEEIAPGRLARCFHPQLENLG